MYKTDQGTVTFNGLFYSAAPCAFPMCVGQHTGAMLRSTTKKEENK